MGNVRDLKVRIRAVGNIRQITRAMEMVATTKLRRFQGRAETSGPYTREIQGLVERLASHVGGGGGHPLFTRREGKRCGVLVVTSDRGLCGAYNTNVLARLRAFEQESADREIVRYVIGKKGMSSLGRRRLPVAACFDDPPLEYLTYRDAARIAKWFAEEFLAGRLDEVVVVYTAFRSMTRYEATAFPFLPLGQVGEAASAAGDLLLEPTPARIFDRLIPKYLESRMFNALLESLTSEYASRRVSMKNATDAATDMVGALRRQYNRARQERITKELLEIVGGAEALAG
jgi:F-type H+-transporting ATPase subunit gamma